MRDLWTPSRTGPQLQAVTHLYEKAGLAIAGQPVPWNAESVLIDAVVRQTSDAHRVQADYRVRTPGAAEPVAPHVFRLNFSDKTARLVFRLPAPTQRTTVELHWRGRSLGQMTLPVIGRDAFRRGVELAMPTVSARLGEHVVPCQTYVSTQCQELLAAAVITAETSLAPIVDLDLRVDIHPEHSGPVRSLRVRLTGAQLTEKSALITVALPKPRRTGAWQATWMLDDKTLATRAIGAVTKPAFGRSLRMLDAQCVVQERTGRVSLMRARPRLRDGMRLGPCFLLGSAEAGMAGLCVVDVRACLDGGDALPMAHQEVAVADGPSVIAPGTLSTDELERVRGFELRVGKRVLGVLPLTDSPSAHFTSEGGFAAADPFLWTDFADQELQERLSRLGGIDK